MKSVIPLGALAAAMILGLSSWVLVPPPPPPLPGPPPYAYAPPPPPPPVFHRHCRLGWHWVPGHHNRFGRWVRGHCAPNR